MVRTQRIPVREYSFGIVMARDPDGGYVVTCPALPGLVTEGDSVQEARDNAAEAILLYLEDLRADGLPVPQNEASEDILVDRVRVSLPA